MSIPPYVRLVHGTQQEIEANIHQYVASVIAHCKTAEEQDNLFPIWPGCGMADLPGRGMYTSRMYMRAYMKEYRRKKRLANPRPVRPPFDRRAYMRSYMLRYRGRQRGRRPSRARVASPSPPMMLPSYYDRLPSYLHPSVLP
jgi:hypothetical protein